MLRALLWKEWREQRSIALAGVALAAVVPAMIVAIGVSTGGSSNFLEISDMVPFLSAVLIWPLFAALAGASTNAGEADGGSFFFLLSRPVSRTRVWAVKTAMGSAASIAVIGVSFVIAQAIDRWAGGPGFSFPFSSDPVQTNLTDAGVQALAVGLVIMSFAGAVFFSTFVGRALSAALAGISLALLAAFTAAWFQRLFSATAGPGNGVEPFLWMTFGATTVALLAGSLHLFRSNGHAGGPEARGAAMRAGAGVLACNLAVMGGAMAATTRVSPANGRLSLELSVPESGAMVVSAFRNRFAGSSLWITGPAGDLQRLARRPTGRSFATPDGNWLVYGSMRGPFGLRLAYCELRAVRPDGSGDHLVATISAPYGYCSIVARVSPAGSILVAQDPLADDALIVAPVNGGAPPRRIELGEEASLLLPWSDRQRQWVGTETEVLAQVDDGFIGIDVESGAVRSLYRSEPSEDFHVEDRSATQVLFQVHRDGAADGDQGPAATTRSMLLDVESGQVVELTLGCAEPQRYLRITTFWRQGRELVYTCASETERRQLKTYDLRSGESALLAELEQPASRLQVAPDGERLWATSTRLGETWIRRQFVVDADGAVREMVLEPGWNIVDWSSDGRLVVTRDADAERLFGYVDPGSDDLAVDVVVRGRNR